MSAPAGKADHPALGRFGRLMTQSERLASPKLQQIQSAPTALP